MRPSYKLTVNGDDITPTVNGRLVDLTLTDERAETADQLDITLDDTDGQLAIPPRNASIELWLGMDNDLVHKGSFTLDEITHSGPPDRISLTARSADFKGPLKIKREQSWHGVSLGDLLTSIAKRNNLKPVINSALAGQHIEHRDQTQSDGDFLTALGQHYGAVATIKHGHLIFAPTGQGKTPTHTAIPPITIHRKTGDQHSYTETDRDTEYTGVKTFWNNKKYARRDSYRAGIEGNVKVISKTYKSEDEAKIAAEKKWKKIKQSGATCSLNLAIGQPLLMPETPVICTGFKSNINERDWIASRVTHTLNDSGYTTQVELELID